MGDQPQGIEVRTAVSVWGTAKFEDWFCWTSDTGPENLRWRERGEDEPGDSAVVGQPQSFREAVHRAGE
jgi:hypothetical protein